VGNKTRWERLRGALADAAPRRWPNSQSQFELKAYTFDADVYEVRPSVARSSARQARGPADAIGAALDEVLPPRGR